MYVEGLGAWRFKSGGARDEGNGFAVNWREEEADMEAIFVSVLFFQLDKVLFFFLLKENISISKICIIYSP